MRGRAKLRAAWRIFLNFLPKEPETRARESARASAQLPEIRSGSGQSVSKYSP